VARPTARRADPKASAPGDDVGDAVSAALASAAALADAAKGVLPGSADGVPDAFAGTWKGTITESGTGDGRATIRLVLTAGAATGRLRFIQLGCSGTVRLTSVIGNLLSMDAVITQDPQGQCSRRSRVWALGQGSGRMQFSVVDNGPPHRAGSGILRL